MRNSKGSAAGLTLALPYIATGLIAACALVLGLSGSVVAAFVGAGGLLMILLRTRLARAHQPLQIRLGFSQSPEALERTYFITGALIFTFATLPLLFDILL
jgi:hypothetical protein